MAESESETKVLKKPETPLFDIIGVSTMEETPFGDAPVNARNPLPLKALMNLLGMPSGPCRRPLGTMTRQGLNVVRDAARRVPAELLAPIGAFFDVDIEARLNDDALLD